MKKLLMIAVMAIIGLSANAQNGNSDSYVEVKIVHGKFHHIENGVVFEHILENGKIVPVRGAMAALKRNGGVPSTEYLSRKCTTVTNSSGGSHTFYIIDKETGVDSI